jgi:hypothetical protein
VRPYEITENDKYDNGIIRMKNITITGGYDVSSVGDNTVKLKGEAP